MTEAEFFPIADMDQWAAFWSANGEHIDIDEEEAFRLACNQCLMIGGGAAPLFCVGFIDRSAYDAALTAFRVVSEQFRNAQRLYRERRIGDAEFLKARAQFDVAQRTLDEAESKL